MRKYRFFLTIIISLVCIFFMALFRPSTYESGLPPEMFWAEKISTRQSVDIVLAGDSRMYRGLSPSHMEEILPGYRILNYGFSAVGYEKRYCDAIEETLDGESSKRCVVLGITPLALTPAACRNNGFISYADQGQGDILLVRILGRFMDFFKPYDTEELYNRIKGSGSQYHQHYYADGWVASMKVPEQPGEGIEYYRNYFRNNVVSEEIIDNLMVWVAGLKKKGVSVFGFRFPASPALIELENEMSGLNEDAFVKDFSEAGGIWLDIPIDAYRTYDGSHLIKESAIQLSYDCAFHMLPFLE
jgi:hypothetical protein